MTHECTGTIKTQSQHMTNHFLNSNLKSINNNKKNHTYLWTRSNYRTRKSNRWGPSYVSDPIRMALQLVLLGPFASAAVKPPDFNIGVTSTGDNTLDCRGWPAGAISRSRGNCWSPTHGIASNLSKNAIVSCIKDSRQRWKWLFSYSQEILF